MITIGIELNHVVRNINKQIVKYYIKEFAQDVDIDDVDCSENVLKTFAKFKSKKEKDNFIYIDYPYEIFGCASTMEKGLSTKITAWLSEISNIEDEDIRVIFYSLYEEALSIQSTYFFLSKIGTRVREVFFPKDAKEVWEHCDVVITANKEVLDVKPEDKIGIKVIGNGNKYDDSDQDFVYDTLSEIIDDEEFFEKIISGKNNVHE